MSRLVEVGFTAPLPSTYTYELPDDLGPGEVGQRVLVPFQNRMTTGFIFGFSKPKPKAEFKIKPVYALLDDIALLTQGLIDLVVYIQKHYGVSLGEALNTVLPPGLIKQTKRKILPLPLGDQSLSESEQKVWDGFTGKRAIDLVHYLRKNSKHTRILVSLQKKGVIEIQSVLQSERAKTKVRKLYSLSEEVVPILRGPKQKQLLSFFKKQSEAVSLDRIKSYDSGLLPTLRSFLKKSIVKEAHVLDDGMGQDSFFNSAPLHTLNAEQTVALDQLAGSLISDQFEKILLYGKTGSGKTEVYLRASALCLEKNQNVLALVPEISLTPQFVGRFRARFGNQIAVLHSGLSETERLTEWKRIRKGEVRLVIGARSAIFSPLENIGLIILDEEHDHSYKQSDGLCYHAKQLAEHRAQTSGASFLLGSATPSLESFYETRHPSTPSSLLTLRERAQNASMPHVEVVNLSKELSKFGKDGLISKRLREEIEINLSRDEQSILFFNRRGYAPVVICSKCGDSVSCAHCSVGLTYHQDTNVYQCHYCGYQEPKAEICSSCKEGKILHLGIGTEAIEKELLRYFPDARIARMDRDSVSKKGSHELILRRLAQKDIDILVGTQMVTKGLDVEHVTLVGVLLADQSLHFPDFRAAETTFQLLTQVIGRSGRGASSGRAILQSFQPEHYAIELATQQNYDAFFEKEIQFRKELLYPPFSHLSLLEVVSADENLTRTSAMWLGKQARTAGQSQNFDLQVLGPAPSPLKKIKDNYRYQVLLKAEDERQLRKISTWLHQSAAEAFKGRSVRFKLDLDPYSFL